MQELPLSIEASIGIAIFPDHGHSAELLIQRADVAMYSAKRENAPFYFYEIGTDEGDDSSLAVVGELRRALDEHELVLHYQPKAVLADGEVRSVEALVRWAHPTRGMIYPDAFIPVAQETSLIRPLTLYVLDEALRQCRAWRDEGLEIAVSVNLSTRNLLDLELPGQVAELLSRWKLEPDLLRLELTESAMLANPKRTTAVLDELSALGVRLSIDDFGTGYSSLVVPAPPADRRDQDRPLVRHRHGRGRGGPHHRPLHDRSRAQPRPRRRGGGRGDAGGMGTAPSAGLHLGPGLLPQPGRCRPRS